MLLLIRPVEIVWWWNRPQNRLTDRLMQYPVCGSNSRSAAKPLKTTVSISLHWKLQEQAGSSADPVFLRHMEFSGYQQEGAEV
jgi:hypothetical protein